MFQEMLDRVEEDALRYLFLIQPVIEQELPQRREQPMYYQQAGAAAVSGDGPRAKKARSTIPSKRKKR